MIICALIENTNLVKQNKQAPTFSGRNSVQYVTLRLFTVVVVKALFYQPDGCGFETWLGEWIFSIYVILPASLGPGIYSASNRNEYQKQKNNSVSGE
jgi:hypothetical protein